MSNSSFKTKIQNFGSFLSRMIMPNIAAFIAWGLLAAIFIETGWHPVEKFAAIVDPILIYALPLLIAYSGGNLVNPKMGGVVGVIATMGAIVGSNEKMLVAAMVLGPLSGFLLKKLQDLYEPHVKEGFEMLINNFSAGILAFLLALFANIIIAPAMGFLLTILEGGVDYLVSHKLLPLVHIFVEPAKILFLNNAINHGIFTPIAADQVSEYGKSILYMIESNPGPGFGVLVAYMLFGQKSQKSSAFGAGIIHLLGGIHEIYFPYVLMNPKLIIATIIGGMGGTFTINMFNGGLVGAASPGSIIAWFVMTPKGGYFAMITGFLVAFALSLVVSSIILKTSKSNEKTLEEAQLEVKESKNKAKNNEKVNLQNVKKICFACDAGMGSSAMGASILKKKAKEKGLDLDISNVAISNLPSDVDLVVTHKDLTDRAKQKLPNAIHVSVDNFINTPKYESLINDLANVREINKDEANYTTEENEDSNVLLKKNIIINPNVKTKEEAIKLVEDLMVNSNYVEKGYKEGMLQREKEAPTHFGIGLAIPHGTNEYKKCINNSGIVVITIKEGIKWDDEIVKLVIGIAGVGDDHLKILANVANNINSNEIVDNLVSHADVDEIYNKLTREE